MNGNNFVSVEIKDSIAVVAIDNPPVNALSHTVRAELLSAYRQTEQNTIVKAVILVGKGRTFIAGADIREFNKDPVKPRISDVANAIAEASKPWLAAIHGVALGGGLEIALACHYRIATQSARLGLPEVTLGLIPGAGGSQRLPRLIDANKALEMIITGKPVTADQACKSGLIDKVAGDDIITEAVTVARSIYSAPIPRLNSKPILTAINWQQGHNLINEALTGREAPLAAIAAVKIACTDHLADGLEQETKIFRHLRDGRESLALRHVFFAERDSAKLPELNDHKPQPITKAIVLGGSDIGNKISDLLLKSGCSVIIVEENDDRRQQLAPTFQASKKSSENLTITSHYDQHINDCNLIIDTLTDNIETKIELLTQLNKTINEHTIIATTDSNYLNLKQIIDINPAHTIGLQLSSASYYNDKLLEIIKHDKTPPWLLATIVKLAKNTGKTVIIANPAPGFIAKRLLETYAKTKNRLITQGAQAQQIDDSLTKFGMNMLPETYSSAAHVQKPEQSASSAIAEESDENTIISTMIDGLTREAKNIVDEGVAIRNIDVDLASISALGFPRWRGGLLYYSLTD